MKPHLALAWGVALGVLGSLLPANAQASDYQTAMGFYQKQEWDKAVPYFRSAITQNPGNWEAYQGMGLCFYEMGDSVTALQLIRRSLALHPDNPDLRKFAERLRPPQSAAPPMPMETPSSSGTKGAKGPPLAPRFWLKASGGYGTAFLGDLGRAPGGFKTTLALQGFDVSKASIGKDGIGMKVEAGYQLDPEDALSLDVFTDSYAGFEGTAASNSAGLTQKLSPTVLAFECGYYRFFPSPGQRFFAGAGLGYYMGSVSCSQKTAGTTIVMPYQGTLSAGDLGLHVSCGYEKQIFDNLGLSLSGEFRLAALNNFTGTLPEVPPKPSWITNNDIMP